MHGQRFHFEHIKCKVPAERGKGDDVKQVVGMASQDLRGKAETRCPGERSACTGRREKAHGRI